MCIMDSSLHMLQILLTHHKILKYDVLNLCRECETVYSAYAYQGLSRIFVSLSCYHCSEQIAIYAFIILFQSAQLCRNLRPILI